MSSSDILKRTFQADNTPSGMEFFDMLTRGAIGNLINRYRAVLKKCRLMNTFGSLAVAVMLTGGAASASPAADMGSVVNADVTISQDTTITADKTTEAGNRYAGIIADSGDMTVTVEDGATLTVNAPDNASAYSFYGAAAQTGGSLTVNGDADFNIKAQDDGQHSRALRANGGDMTLNGNIHAVAETTSGTAVGAEVWSGADMTFNGEETILEAVSTGGMVIGVQNFHQSGDMSTMNFNADRTVISVRNDAQSEEFTQGVLAYQSTTNFTGNTEITVRGGEFPTYGVDVQCDPGNLYDTTVNFSGDNTVFDVAGTADTYAVRPFGVPGSINFTGNTVTIRAASSVGEASGIRSQYGAHVNASADMNIAAKSASGSAFGVFLKAMPTMQATPPSPKI